MSSPVEQPGGTNEPSWAEGGTAEGTMKKHFLKDQLEGASEQAWRKRAPNLLELSHPVEMSQSGGAGAKQSVASSHVCKGQAAEPEMQER